MGEGRWDVQVLGLDPEHQSASLASHIARRLGAETAQIERLIAHAPTTLVADLDEAAAKALVQELRALGVRVKPRPSGSIAPPARRSAPPPTTTPRVAPRASMPVTDERATAPTMALPIPETRSSPLDPFLTPAAAPATHAPSGSRSQLEAMNESFTGASGLELEDVAPPTVHPSRISAFPPGDTRPPASPSPAAPSPRLAERPEPAPEAPRVFWSALPAAFFVPLRRSVLPGLFLAPLFIGTAVFLSVLGSFMALVGVLVMTAAYVGVTLQVSHRCLWATAVGERMPASLAGGDGFLADYAFPGLTVVIVQGMLTGIAAWGAFQAQIHGVPMVVLEGLGVLFGLYMVIGYAFAAAGRSAMGLLDVARIVRVLVMAPFEVIAIVLVGGLVQGTAIAIAIAQVAAVVTSGGGIGGALLAAAGATFVLGFVGAYGIALTATMMGMLFWARPEVAAG